MSAAPSIATVHRKAVTAAAKLGEHAPSYSLVYALVRKMDPALLLATLLVLAAVGVVLRRHTRSHTWVLPTFLLTVLALLAATGFDLPFLTRAVQDTQTWYHQLGAAESPGTVRHATPPQDYSVLPFAFSCPTSLFPCLSASPCYAGICLPLAASVTGRRRRDLRRAFSFPSA